MTDEIKSFLMMCLDAYFHNHSAYYIFTFITKGDINVPIRGVISIVHPHTAASTAVDKSALVKITYVIQKFYQ